LSGCADDRAGLSALRPAVIDALRRGVVASPSAHFRSVLNLSYGFDDQDWIGAEIELYVGLTRFKGEDRDSVLIKPISPAKPDATRTPRRSTRKSGDNMDDEIPF
jgi:hypothetical protein